MEEGGREKKGGEEERRKEKKKEREREEGERKNKEGRKEEGERRKEEGLQGLHPEGKRQEFLFHFCTQLSRALRDRLAPEDHKTFERFRRPCEVDNSIFFKSPNEDECGFREQRVLYWPHYAFTHHNGPNELVFKPLFLN